MTSINLAVLAALEDEIRTLRHRLSGPERLPLASGRVTAGTWGRLPLLLVRTGVGAAATSRVMGHLLNHYPPGLALQVGYGGATLPDLLPGDLIIATTLIDASRGLCLDVAPELVARAEAIRRQTGLPGRCGRLLTLLHPALTPREKAAWGREHQALALDMESAVFGAACRAAGLPFLVVRAVLDPLDYRLPNPVRRPAAEKTGPPRANPFKTPPLSEFADRARRNLTAFAAAWLDDLNERL